jgi:hypothetical protein
MSIKRDSKKKYWQDEQPNMATQIGEAIAYRGTTYWVVQDNREKRRSSVPT